MLIRRMLNCLPKPTPPDVDALARVEALHVQLVNQAARLGLDARRLNTEPYERGAALERTEGYSSLSRAFIQVANANAAIYRAREAAEGKRGTPHAYFEKARKELAETVTAIDAVHVAVAAE